MQEVERSLLQLTYFFIFKLEVPDYTTQLPLSAYTFPLLSDLPFLLTGY